MKTFVRSLFLSIGIVAFICCALFVLLFGFAEGETHRGTLAYYVRIPGVIAHVPEIGTVSNVGFSYGFYDNGSPQSESIYYCTDAKKKEVLKTLDKYFTDQGLKKKSALIWSDPTPSDWVAEIEVNYEKDLSDCPHQNKLSVSNYSWPQESKQPN